MDSMLDEDLYHISLDNKVEHTHPGTDTDLLLLWKLHSFLERKFLERDMLASWIVRYY